MIIERPLETGQPRRDVWCSSSDIADNGDGTFSFVNMPNENLGFGSKIHVVDASEHHTYYFDNATGLLYEWTHDGGGGETIVVSPLTITQNGVIVAPQGEAYSPLTVEVPNTYVAEDEDKVVQNGELVEQTTETITQNGIVNTTTIKTLTVNVPTGGGGGIAPKAVNFRDYDGTIVNSYTAAEFAALSAMPDNPTHDGLTAQGWNWTLTDAKAYVASYGRLEIGQMYTTSDGKLHVKIQLEEGRLSPYLGIGVNGTADIDWGDNSTHDTITGTSVTTVINTLHNYAAPGEYDIAVGTTGSLGLVGNGSYGSQLLWKNSTTIFFENRAYQSAIKEVNIPNTMTNIELYAFYHCYSLTNVTIPDSVTSIKGNAFDNCYSLTNVVIPDSVTSIGDIVFNNCYSLTNVVIPDSVTSIGNSMFRSCYNLANVIIPNTIIGIGSSAFMNCYSLANVTIPDSVTSINTAGFISCFGLGFIRFTSPTPPTVSSSNAFQSLPTDCIIYVPTGSLTAYTTATNYPSAATYTYIEY